MIHSCNDDPIHDHINRSGHSYIESIDETVHLLSQKIKWKARKGLVLRMRDTYIHIQI